MIKKTDQEVITNLPKESGYKISEDKNSLNEIFLLISKNQNPIIIKSYTFNVIKNISTKGYILKEANKLIDDFKIFPPKEIKISDISFTAYNFNSLYAFFKKKNIDPNNLYLDEKKFNISNIFSSKIKTFTFLLKNKNNINFGEYKVSERDESSELLSKLINPDKKYVKYNQNSIYYSNGKRDNLLQDIYGHDINEGILYIYGPSGIGKTITLLKFRQFNYNTLYLNLKDIFKTFDIKDIFNSLIGELSFIFKDNGKFNEYINQELMPIIQSKILYDGKDVFCELLAHIIKTRDQFINMDEGNKLYVIIDQYKSVYDKSLKIKNILSNSIEIASVICSSFNEEIAYDDYNKMLFLDIKNNNIIYLSNFGAFTLTLSSNKLNLIKEFGDLPKYIEEINILPEDEIKINEYRAKKIKDIKAKIESFIACKTFNNPYYKISNIVKDIIQYEGIDISINIFTLLFLCIPLKYFVPIKISNNFFKFYYSFPLLKNILECILIDNISEINTQLMDDSVYSIQTAWNFEILVQNFFSLEKKPFNDLDYFVKSQIEVNSIYDFQEIIIKAEYNNKNIGFNEDNEYIFKLSSEKKDFYEKLISLDGITNISQKPYGESYDGAILIPTNKNNQRNFHCLLYQVTLDRATKNFICREKIMDSLPNIKKKFESVFNINIVNFYFTYILNYYRKGITNVERLCNYYVNKLYYCFYDNKNKKLRNKNNIELKWSLLKTVGKLRNYSKIYKEFSKNSYLSNLFLKDAYERISLGKLNKENEEDIINNSFLNKNIDFVYEQNNNLTNNKRKRACLNKDELNISKKDKKDYIENNKIKKVIDFLPDNLNQNEKIFVDKNEDKYTFKKNYQLLIEDLLKKNNINNIIRGIFPITCLFGNDDYAILYIGLKEENAILVYFSKEKEKLLLYDLLNNGNNINYEDKKFLDLLNPITSLNNYISYLFEINELNE